MTTRINPGLLAAAQLYGKQLKDNFSKIDGNVTGVKDGFLSPEELRAAVKDETLATPLRVAAKNVLGELGKHEVNTPMGLVRPDTALFDLFDTITAPGKRDNQISMAELDGVLGAQAAQGWTGSVTLHGVATESGQSLPATRNIEVSAIDDATATVKYQGASYTLKRAQIDKATSDGFNTSHDAEDAFITQDGSYLVKYAMSGGTGAVSDLALYVKLSKPADGYLVSADLSRTPISSEAASLDPADDARAFVGLTAAEGSRSFVSIDNMPEMPYEGHSARFDDLDLPTSPRNIWR